MGRTSHADRVREHARRAYIDPARRRHDSTIKISAGEVQKAVKLSNRVSLVCQALKSHKFHEENHLSLEKWDGPPSGMSTTVTFTYRLLDEISQSETSRPNAFPGLRGVAKDVFQSLGGGEAFIRQEREQFHGRGKNR